MSTVDPLKQKSALPPLDQNPPTKTEAPKKKPVDLDYVPQAPPLHVAGLFPNAHSESPGVSATVFGPVSPDLRAMGDAELAKKTSQVFAAIKANPGKANAYDIKLATAMVNEMGRRADTRLSAPMDPSKLGNGDILMRLLLVDLKKLNGPLNKAEAENASKLEAEWKKRIAADATKQLAGAQAQREQLKKQVVFQCAAAGGAAFGALSPGGEAFSLLGSGALIYHEASEGHYGAALFEGTATVAALALHKSPIGKGIEVVMAGLNAGKCAVTLMQLHQADQEVKKQEASVAKAKP